MRRALSGTACLGIYPARAVKHMNMIFQKLQIGAFLNFAFHHFPVDRVAVKNRLQPLNFFRKEKRILFFKAFKQGIVKCADGNGQKSKA